MLNAVHHAQDTGRFKRPVRLLIVDDDPIDRQRYLRFLREDTKTEYVVVESATAEEGLQQINEGIFDCIVLDYSLPEADGLSVFQSIRENAGRTVIPPVVMTTGNGCESVAVEALKSGVSDYLTKNDLTATAFRRAVSRAIERSRLQLALRDQHQRLQQVNTELSRQAAELERFYQTVSHELKTPLAAAREFMSLLRDGIGGPPLPPSQAEFVVHAIEGCDQMVRQVNDLLDSARLTNGKVSVQKAPTSIASVIDFALASVRRGLETRGLQLSREVAPDLPPVMADFGRLAQVVGNLLNNAVKFTREAGSIRVGAGLHPGSTDRVEVWVSDDGCGIPPEHLDLIFDRLYQVPIGGEYSTNGGMGLGLSIAQELVQLHGGSLRVESEVGVGSIFRFNLEVAVPPVEIPS